MKVPESIGDIFDRHVEEVRRLASLAEGLIRGHLHKEWHFVGRVKDRESFALKIETGRVNDPGKLEDFYACTIVVRNNAEIIEAERIINELFEVGTRRPPKPNYTHSEPSSFDFDHLRLYAAWKPDEALPPTGLEGRLFKVQIKTYLQHAWSIATHDLVYKTDDVNWRKARVAYQVKAMLEHAETSIAYAANFADIAELQMENRSLDELRKVIEVLKEEWRDDPARLPRDIRRLAESVLSVIKSIGLTPEVLRSELAKERAAGRGALVETLSPYGVVLETLLNRRLPDLQRFLTDRSSRSRRTKIVFASEVSYQGKIDPAACQNGIFISTTPAA